MRSIERLEKQRRNEAIKRANLPPPDEETEEELEFPAFVALNKMSSIFDDSADKKFGGINTAPSVFDKTAAIKTN